MAFRFRVFLADGTDLEDLVSSEPNWNVGHMIRRGNQEPLRVIDVIVGDGDPYTALLVVERAKH